MNSALHGASLSPDNVIPAKAGLQPRQCHSGEGRIQAPGLFLVLKTTREKTHVVPVERVPEKTGKWNPVPAIVIQTTQVTGGVPLDSGPRPAPGQASPE